MRSSNTTAREIVPRQLTRKQAGDAWEAAARRWPGKQSDVVYRRQRI